MPTTPENARETLQAIRGMMERSGRFISLSGLSGVSAGIFALLGAAVAIWYLGATPFDGVPTYYEDAVANSRGGMKFTTFFLLDAGLVLIAALTAGIFFTVRRARRAGQPVWGPLTVRLLLNLAIPLAAGGLFCVALMLQEAYSLVAPATLIFYGLALLNGSKYTVDDIRKLGLAEIALGLVGAFLPGYGLELWAVGFGVLHIVYGIIMWNKYER